MLLLNQLISKKVFQITYFCKNCSEIFELHFFIISLLNVFQIICLSFFWFAKIFLNSVNDFVLSIFSCHIDFKILFKNTLVSFSLK